MRGDPPSGSRSPGRGVDRASAETDATPMRLPERRFGAAANDLEGLRARDPPRGGRPRRVSGAWNSWRTYERRPLEERFSQNVATLFQSVVVSVNQLGGHTVRRPSPNTLVISRKTTGLVGVLACVILFPFGFLALLPRRTKILTITVDKRDDGFEVSALGEGDPAIIGALERFLAEMVAPEGRLEVERSPASAPARRRRHELRPWGAPRYRR